MKPTDYPIEMLGQVESTLIGQADQQRERARLATAGAPDHTWRGDKITPADRESASVMAAGYYESALAYYESARQVRQAIQNTIAHLDALAAQEAALIAGSAHPWPIEHLENLTLVHRGDDGLTGDFQQLYPRWGVLTDGADGKSVAVLTASPCTHEGHVILTSTEGDGSGRRPADSVTHVLSFEQWDALVDLVERIKDGQPMPYDIHGNTRTRETAQ